MITAQEVLSVIKARAPQWVIDARKEQVRLSVHIDGIGTGSYLKQIDKIESQEQMQLRKRYLDTNRHLFVTLSRPISKVFSAKGGERIFNLNSASKEKQMQDALANVRHGKSIRQWIKGVQSKKYYTDPAGLVFFEWKDKRTWPTLKSIQTILSYRSDGRVPEWVIFEPYRKPNDEREYYRVVDEAFDYLYAKQGDLLTLVEDETMANPFGQVPAIINSEVINANLTHAESPFEIVISLADHYLRTGTIKNIVEFLHGYPIFWRYLTECPTCHGVGYVANEDGDENKLCPSCHGSGVNLKKDITDVIQLQTPKDDTQPVLTPDVAGYVTPPVESWRELRVEQQQLRELMELTMWGSKMVKDASNETATAAFLNVQPVNDRLHDFADAFEDLEKKMTDLIGIYLFGTYEGASISYGRRFLVEGPDVIWKKYDDARTAGAPKVTLDYLLEQFYESEYANDITSLTAALKGMQLEPFIHKTDEQVKAIGVSAEDVKRKLYFGEWYKALPQADILSKDVPALRKEFEAYIKSINYATEEVQ